MAKKVEKEQELSYEDAFIELQHIVQLIEQGNHGVDELLKMVNKASELVLYCREKLRKAEDDLNQIISTNDNLG
ncbi:MAG: exodeoxyribonuclease VII small subunit [Bacteroidia bacterium]|jgi:exodeoxyribonuclease VII small subunit